MNYFRIKEIALFILVLNWGNSLRSQCYELIWADEFNYTGLPAASMWTPETGGGGWGNNELQFYTKNDADNAYVEDGRLVITALKEDYITNDYTSARIITRDLFEVQYGKIESRIKLPYTQGIWPAFWMLGANYPEVGWPACGEIDIMEMIGGKNNDNTIHGTAHWENNGQHAEYGGNYTLNSGIFADDYHVFAIEWDKNRIRWLIDGQQYHVISITPEELSEFRNEFFILLNVAVGGNWPGYPDETSTFPQTMEVDYVRVYKKSENVSQLKITGDTIVHQFANDTKYALPHSPDLQYKWGVGGDAEIIGPTDSSAIEVNWGCNTDTLSCTVTGSCGAYIFKQVIHIDQEIKGPTFIESNESGVIFTIDDISETTYAWSVPEDAAIISGEFNNTLTVNWGNIFEPVQLIMENSCGITELELPVIRLGQYPYPDINIPHKIPGMIIATDFDYGGEGLGYHDITNGNNGEGPRQNTDVDTEYNSDGSSNIGWIENGEWVEYTIEVAADTFYKVEMNVATQNAGGGPFSVHVNGEVRLADITVPNTGSWRTFIEIEAGTLFLQEKDSVLRLSFDVGGFNVKDISFTPVNRPLDTDLQAAQQTYSIFPVPAQRYVNLQTTQPLRMIRVVNTNGSVVMYRERLDTGTHRINIERLPRGIYFIQMIPQAGLPHIEKLVKKE